MWIRSPSRLIQARLTFSCLGITVENMEICAYDFYSHHVLSEFDGVLGLDFFKKHTFCINLEKEFILIQ
jgi:hypothetical protein